MYYSQPLGVMVRFASIHHVSIIVRSSVRIRANTNYNRV